MSPCCIPPVPLGELGCGPSNGSHDAVRQFSGVRRQHGGRQYDLFAKRVQNKTMSFMHPCTRTDSEFVCQLVCLLLNENVCGLRDTRYISPHRREAALPRQPSPQPARPSNALPQKASAVRHHHHHFPEAEKILLPHPLPLPLLPHPRSHPVPWRPCHRCASGVEPSPVGQPSKNVPGRARNGRSR